MSSFQNIHCTGAEKIPQSEYWIPENPDLLHHLEHFHIPAKKTRHISLDILEPKTLSWYFRTDGDVFFGIFYEVRFRSYNQREYYYYSYNMGKLSVDVLRPLTSDMTRNKQRFLW